MKYTELEKKLRKAGCYQIGNGDHPIWYSPITEQRFATGHHDTHEVNPKTLNKILKAPGLNKSHSTNQKCLCYEDSKGIYREGKR